MTYGIIGFSAHLAIPSGWNTLPLGAGGLVTGLSIANDGSMVCRTDVGNIYRWSGKTTDYADSTKKWLPLLNFSSLSSALGGGLANPSNNNIGGWEHVLAPGNSAVHVAVFCDMAGVGTKNWIWYSTNSGVTWSKSNIAFTSGTAASNGTDRYAYYKIAVDPVNENVAYCGMPYNSGNSAGVYTSLNRSGGSTLATWTAVTTNGVTALAVPTSAGIVSCGLAIDPSVAGGTTTIAGQTVSKHIILPIGGVGIYESTDGGLTFTEIAVTAFGTSSFWVTNGGFNAGGVYYAVVVSTTAFGLWRYASGTWTNITPSAMNTTGDFAQETILIIDPRSAHQGYLSITGPHGIGAGFTTTGANTGTPTWTGLTSQQLPNLLAASYDIPYLNYIFGQQVSPWFAFGPCAGVDSNGNCFWGGNQSLWYFGTSNVDPTPSGTPTYANTTFPSTFVTNSWSMGRGQEATVSQDVLVPLGGVYPILAPQDLGAPMRGTFTTYPQNLGVQFAEYDCASLEYAASDPSFVIACTTGQGAPNVTSYLYSTNYGADGTWNAIAGSPDSFWNGGGTSVSGGQVVAVDHDNWIAVPAGFAGSYQPAHTANATTTASWALCTGLPSASWIMVSWNFASHTSKPFAVGYGTDQGTVWACLIVTGSTTATLYRSTDSGATFSSVATWTISAAAVAVYCLSVPGRPDELWITGAYTGGSNTSLWHVTNARTGSPPTVTAVTLPGLAALPLSFTLGAPSSPGGYPTLYLHGWASSGATQYLYQGSWNGSTVTWSLFGTSGQANGINPDLPASCQVCGIQAIRGDPNVYQRLYVSSNQSGYAYYNP